METSILAARLFAPIYLSVGLGMLFSQKHYKKMLGELMHATPMAYLGGIMAVVVGMLIVSYHNVWEVSWTLIVTLIGWLALIKGALLLIIPEAFINLASPLFKSKFLPTIGVSTIILGLVLGYFGFFI